MTKVKITTNLNPTTLTVGELHMGSVFSLEGCPLHRVYMLLGGVCRGREYIKAVNLETGEARNMAHNLPVEKVFKSVEITAS